MKHTSSITGLLGLLGLVWLTGCGGPPAAQFSYAETTSQVVAITYGEHSAAPVNPIEAALRENFGTPNSLVVWELFPLDYGRGAVRVATTESGDLSETFDAGRTIDGVVLAEDDRILVKDQFNPNENGIYVVGKTGQPPFRAGDLENESSAVGVSVWVSEGTVNKRTRWDISSPATAAVVGTDPLSFEQVVPDNESVAFAQQSHAGWKIKKGRDLYMVHCLHCHGTAGDGNGPTAKFLNPKPRDYRMGVFKFTSTNQGIKPSRHDLKTILENGIPGTSMPSFGLLEDEELNLLLEYVRFLSIRGEYERRLFEGVKDFATADAVKAAADDFDDPLKRRPRLEIVQLKLKLAGRETTDSSTTSADDRFAAATAEVEPTQKALSEAEGELAQAVSAESSASAEMKEEAAALVKEKTEAVKSARVSHEKAVSVQKLAARAACDAVLRNMQLSEAELNSLAENLKGLTAARLKSELSASELKSLTADDPESWVRSELPDWAAKLKVEVLDEISDKTKYAERKAREQLEESSVVDKEVVVEQDGKSVTTKKSVTIKKASKTVFVDPASDLAEAWANAEKPEFVVHPREATVLKDARLFSVIEPRPKASDTPVPQGRVKLGERKNGYIQVKSKTDETLGWIEDAYLEARTGLDPATGQPTAESIRHGRQMFLSDDLKCYQCHGSTGRGDGSNTEIHWPVVGSKPERFYENVGLHDDWGNPLPPRNLTRGQYRGGRRPIDLYRRLFVGIKGAKMPAFASGKYQGNDLTDADLWDIINFVQTLPFEGSGGSKPSETKPAVAESVDSELEGSKTADAERVVKPEDRGEIAEVRSP